MPFLPELNFFYLYVRDFIQQNYDMPCARADSRYYTGPFIDKIRRYILEATVIIADITGNNPNVFYELGVAHALNKSTIILTQDIDQRPSDIQHFDMIQYSLDNDRGLITDLKKALGDILGEEYDELYVIACQTLNDFRQAGHSRVREASRDVFVERVRLARSTEVIPDSDNVRDMQEFLLPKMIENPSDSGLMRAVFNWLSERT